MKSFIKKFLFYELRINRCPSNGLAMSWLKKDLIKFSNLEIAIDVGCGKFINKRHFKNKFYIGIDSNEEFLKKGQSYHPNTKYYCSSILDKIPIKGDLLVSTLVLTNELFPKERTLEAVMNLTEAVNKSGSLIITIGKSNYIFKDQIIKILDSNFKKIYVKQYGNFNKKTFLSRFLVFLMAKVPRLRIDENNKMFYIHAENKR